MKKALLTACLILATTSMSFAATNTPAKTPTGNQIKQQQAQKLQKPPKRPNLEQRLNLTEEQIAKAKTIREQGHKQMKPVMDSLKSKIEQKHLLMQNKTPGVKEVKKLEQLNKDIEKLKQQAKTIRDKNNKQFEAILTDTQKEQFNQMKREGRREFEKKHPPKFMGGQQGQNCPQGMKNGQKSQGEPPKGSFPPPPPPEK